MNWGIAKELIKYIVAGSIINILFIESFVAPPLVMKQVINFGAWMGSIIGSWWQSTIASTEMGSYISGALGILGIIIIVSIIIGAIFGGVTSGSIEEGIQSLVLLAILIGGTIFVLINIVLPILIVSIPGLLLGLLLWADVRDAWANGEAEAIFYLPVIWIFLYLVLLFFWCVASFVLQFPMAPQFSEYTIIVSVILSIFSGFFVKYTAMGPPEVAKS